MRGLFVIGAVIGLCATAAGAPPPKDEVISIVVVGDVGLNRSNQKMSSLGVGETGWQPWRDTTSGIAALIDGDLNFLNLETVVTDSNKIPRDSKGQKHGFNFRTHPQGVRHLIRVGFNLVSLANNHSYDYGEAGARDTVHFMDSMYREGLLAHAGVGVDAEEASRPRPVVVKNTSIAFSSIGILTNMNRRHRAGDHKPGQMGFRYAADFARVVKRLADKPADYRILSIHYGYERKVRVDQLQRDEWRGHAVHRRGIDMIIGHHAHVPRGIELTGNRVIFYGLGNFLHRGTMNMGAVGVYRGCRDFGVLAKVHLLRRAGKRPVPRALEIVPVTQMHYQPRRFSSVSASHRRVRAVNYLSAMLDDAKSGARGVRFTPQSDGSGLWCAPGAAKDPGRIGTLCRQWSPVAVLSDALQREVKRDCRVLTDKDLPKRKKKKLSKRERRRQAKAKRKAKLRKAKLRKAKLRKAKLRKAKLRKAKLRKARLRKARLRKAKLRKARQRKARQRKARQRKR